MARGRPRRYDANDFLIEVWRSHQRQHMPPTIQELADMFDPKPSTRTVLRYLRSLEAAGCLRRWPGARGIAITPSGRFAIRVALKRRQGALD